MVNKKSEEKFPLINELSSELSSLDGNLNLTTKDNSICIGHIQLDKSTQEKTLMTSCIKKAHFLQKTFYIYLTEQHSKNNNINKFSFKLTDDKKVSLKQYDKGQKKVHIYIIL